MVKSALIQSFQAADHELNKAHAVDTEQSGSTCVAMLVLEERIFCANLGDSAAYMIQRMPGKLKMVQLSRAHLPTVKEEHDRILRCGGRIDSARGTLESPPDSDGLPYGPPRVWKRYENSPGLMMTRSFGDQVGHSIGLISIPEISEFRRQDCDWAVCVGSDGLWDNMDEEGFLQAVRAAMADNDPTTLATDLVERAEHCWNRKLPSSALDYVDDITCLFAIL